MVYTYSFFFIPDFIVKQDSVTSQPVTLPFPALDTGAGFYPIFFFRSDPYLLTLTVGTRANVFRRYKYIKVNTNVDNLRAAWRSNAGHRADPTFSDKYNQEKNMVHGIYCV